MSFTTAWRRLIQHSKRQYPQLWSPQNRNLWELCSKVDNYLQQPSGYKETQLVESIANNKKLLNVTPDIWNDAFDEILTWLETRLASGSRLVRGKTVCLVPFRQHHATQNVNSARGEPFDWFNPTTQQWEEQRMGESPGYDAPWNIAAENVICLDSPNLATKLGELHSRDDVLYVVGHGKPHHGYIYESQSEQAKISEVELVVLLEGKLNRSFLGAIKIYSCYSSVGRTTAASFCQRFANCMFVAEYRSCHFYGYSHTVSISRYRKEKEGAPHKMAPGIGTGVRALTARVQIEPERNEKARTKYEYLLGKQRV